MRKPAWYGKYNESRSMWSTTNKDYSALERNYETVMRWLYEENREELLFVIDAYEADHGTDSIPGYDAPGIIK